MYQGAADSRAKEERKMTRDDVLAEHGMTLAEVEEILYDHFDDALCVYVTDSGKIRIKSVLPHTSETVGWWDYCDLDIYLYKLKLEKTI